MVKPDEIARMSKVLSADKRVRILQLLSEHQLCVGALADKLGISQGAVSQHLRILTYAGLVIPEKRGYFMHYHINRDALDDWNSTFQKLLGKAPDSNGVCRSMEGGKTCVKKKKSASTRKS